MHYSMEYFKGSEPKKHSACFVAYMKELFEKIIGGDNGVTKHEIKRFSNQTLYGM